MHIELLYFEGCPNWHKTDADLRALSAEFGFELTRHLVDTPEAAERLRFRGSPTVRIDGTDPFARGDEPVGLACRIYQTPEGPAGFPATEQLRDVISTERPGG